MLTQMILFTFSGLLLVALSIPLILKKIGPNPLYGFRVKQTLENPDVWYVANAYAAKRLLIFGLVITTVAIILFFLPGMDLLTYSISCGVIGILGLIAVVIQSFLFLQTIQGNP